jgi:hypothetical protein
MKRTTTLKKGDLVVHMGNNLAFCQILETPKNRGWTRMYNIIDDYHTTRIASYFRKAMSRDIERCLQYMFEKVNKIPGNKFKTFDHEITFTGESVEIGCQTISLDDALDIADLIKSKITR